MNYGLYLSASGVLTNMHRQDVASANLANSGTVGFKRSMAALAHRAPESEQVADASLSHKLLDRLGGGVFVAPTRVDLEPGQLEPTGNDFDLGIDGPGFFVVRDNDGRNTKNMLTRDGRLTLSPDGHLVTTTGGHQLLSKSGQPITLDVGEGVQVDQHGRIHQGGSVVGELNVINPPQDQVRHAGLGLYETSDAVLKNADDSTALVRQGHVERSNVDTIREMLDLMSANRAISGSANLIRYHDSVMDRAVNVLGRVA